MKGGSTQNFRVLLACQLAELLVLALYSRSVVCNLALRPLFHV